MRMIGCVHHLVVADMYVLKALSTHIMLPHKLSRVLYDNLLFTSPWNQHFDVYNRWESAATSLVGHACSHASCIIG